MSPAEEYRDHMIANGIEGVRAANYPQKETEAYVRGFERCRGLSTPEQFQSLLKFLEKNISEAMESADIDAYWELRWQQCQVEWVYERLCLLWDVPRMYHASAILHYAAWEEEMRQTAR